MYHGHITCISHAAILKSRIEEGIEQFIQKTQYGSRKERGTEEAIHCVRRLTEYAEQTGEPTILVLLDWEKAFDRISHEAVRVTLERMQTSPMFIRHVMYIYIYMYIYMYIQKSTILN